MLGVRCRYCFVRGTNFYGKRKRRNVKKSGRNCQYGPLAYASKLPTAHCKSRFMDNLQGNQEYHSSWFLSLYKTKIRMDFFLKLKHSRHWTYFLTDNPLYWSIKSHFVNFLLGLVCCRSDSQRVAWTAFTILAMFCFVWFCFLSFVSNQFLFCRTDLSPPVITAPDFWVN